MGLSLSRGRHANLVVLCIPFFGSTRAASTLPSRPHISIAVAAQRRSRTALLQRRRRLVLDGREHGGRLPAIGWLAVRRSEGSLPLAAINRANHACIRLNPYGVPTMKQSYASAGKAPRRRVHSLSGIAAIAECGLPPPRIVIGNPAYQVRSGCRTLFVLSRSRVLLTPPAAARHRPAPRRS